MTPVYDYDEFLKGYDELMLHTLDREEEMSSIREQQELHERLMTGNASDDEVDSFVRNYFEKNASVSVILFEEVPLTETERDHIIQIMKSMYYVKTGQHTSGHFVGSVLGQDLKAVAYADKTNLRALKWNVWFHHNELVGIHGLTESEE